MTDHNLNDELNPQHELASAYLDGAASPAERAQVEAAPELQAIVASFTVVQALVGDVPIAVAGTRQAAFAAAFAEFDAPALAPEARGAANIAMGAKQRWARPLLSVAAAVLLVGAIGVAVKSGSGGDDSKSSSATLDSSAKVASADLATESQMTSNTMAAMAPSTIGSIGRSAQAALIIDTPAQLQALAVSPPAGYTVPTTGSPESTAAASENTTTADTVQAPTDLAGTTFTRLALSCLTAQQVFLADIRYRGIFAIAAHDTVTGMTSAITDDCTVLATVGP